jgi:methionyl-tRNA formyltransferase
MRVAFLVSGGLGETVLNHFIHKLNIPFVLTDKNSKGIIDLCENHRIPFYAGNPRDKNIDNFIMGLECDFIASINYLFLIERKIISIAKDLCFNIHGSLLPKYRGRTPHVWAIINGEKQTGISAHIINEGCDTGAIIKQIIVNIDAEDTGWDILEKYKKLYVPIVEDILESHKENALEFVDQDESKATFFGKRTSNDGRIDWNWSVDRIINWVRAQSYPYPGAYTFYNKEKIIIDKVAYSDHGFHFEMQNGTILSTSPLVVKCITGAIELVNLRTLNTDYRKNEVLN